MTLKIALCGVPIQLNTSMDALTRLSAFASTANYLFGLGIISEPLQWALMYWVRRSEFSADRVAAYVTNDADVVARTTMRLAGGGTRITERVDMEQFIKQAADYQKFMKDSGKSKFLQSWMIKDVSHPYPAVRAAEVKKWFAKSMALLCLYQYIDIIFGMRRQEDENLSWIGG